MSWKIVKLADCARIVSGATPKTSAPQYWDGDIPWVTPKDISNLDGFPFLDSTPRTLTADGLASCSAEILPPRSVLLSSRAPIGLVAINRIPVATNQGFKSFVPDASRLDAGFLYHWLRANRPFLENLGTGATFKEISKTVMTRVEIPLPPLDEQKRIAAVLDKADALRRQRQESLQLTEKLLQSVFIDMFGDPATNPMGWPVVPLSDLASKFSDGPFGSNLKSSHYTDSGIRVLRLQNIGIGILKDADISFISREHYNSLPRHHCKPGDVIVGTMGDPNLRAAIIPKTLKESLNKADCVQIRPKDKVATAEYLCWLINMPGTLAMAHNLVLGETRARVSMGRLKTLKVPKPPVELQQVFGVAVAKIVEMKAEELYQAAIVDSFFSSLQQRAFCGELDLSRLNLDEVSKQPKHRTK